MAVDWAALPPDLLQTIAEKLKTLIDYVRFRSTCTTWKSSSPPTPLHLPTQLPWLLLPHHHHHHDLRSFFNLSANKLHCLSLPESTSHLLRLRGSSHGHLIIVDESPSILLLNPLTKSKLYLPPLSSFPNVLAFSFHNIGREYTLVSLTNALTYTRNLKQMRDSFIKKIVLSSNPSINPDYMALAILNQTGDLVFCKKGDKSWGFIENVQCYYEDAIYWNGLFYAVNKIGDIAVCDVLCQSSDRVSMIYTPIIDGGDMQYLVGTENELLLVTRYLDSELDDMDFVYRTVEFRVYRLDFGGPRWERVMSLGDRMLFLGMNSSLAFSASEFSGCKGNCIYYTDDYSELDFDGVYGDLDLGVYNLEDASIEPLPCYPHSRLSPIWVTPNPC